MMYALDGKFFWYITGDALRIRAWCNVYVVDDGDLHTGQFVLKNG